MKIIKVVCGVIYKKDKVLIARRRKGISQEGKWEFPGGKVELNESNEFSLARELYEEFGMEIIINQKLGENLHSYPDIKINLIAYCCDFVSASFSLTSHDKYQWVKTNELINFDLTEADIPLISLL